VNSLGASFRVSFVEARLANALTPLGRYALLYADSCLLITFDNLVVVSGQQSVNSLGVQTFECRSLKVVLQMR
jgi:hypothetical protein